MDVIEIVKNWLLENGYDGLVDPDRECGCQISDLMPCGEGFEKCEAAHKKEADPKTGWDFLMFPGKAQPEDSADCSCFFKGDYCEYCGVTDDLCHHPSKYG